jgi:hypothetical protein
MTDREGGSMSSAQVAQGLLLAAVIVDCFSRRGAGSGTGARV